MNNKRYAHLTETLLSSTKKVADSKRHSYTGGSDDVLANFKRIAERLNVDPFVILGVYLNKQVDAVNTYIKDGTLSEPFEGRIVDCLNYIFLAHAMYVENEEASGKNVITSTEELENYAENQD